MVNTSKDNGRKAASSAEAPAYTVHESVIISLARKAVDGIPGFIRFSGSSLVSDLADLVGGKRRFDKSIVVTENGANVSLEILIVVAYGSKFSEVAAAIQKAVYHQISEFTGLNVKSIDVIITDTEEASADESEDGDVVEAEIVQ